MNLGFLGKGNASLPARCASRSRPARRPEAARGLGHDAGRDRRCLRVADEFDVQVAIHTDTLNESGFVEDTVAAFKGRTIHTYPHRGRGRRPRARHHQARRPANVLPSSTNPTVPYTVNTHRRASRHADGVPPPRPVDRRRYRVRRDRRIRRETIAAEDILHDLGAFSMMSSRLAGDGSRRRSDHPHVADGAQDEGSARARSPAIRRTTTTPRQALHRQIHDQPGDRARRLARRRFDRAGQARRPRVVEAGVLRREAGADPEGRHDRRRGDGRPQRIDPDAPAGACPADVRQPRQGAAHVGHVRVAGVARQRIGGGPWTREAAASPCRTRATWGRRT